jgi:hypothetical protein
MYGRNQHPVRRFLLTLAAGWILGQVFTINFRYPILQNLDRAVENRK